MQIIKRLLPGSEEMALALVVWLCTLPLIALVVAPLLGRQAAISIAIVVSVLVLGACWIRCLFIVTETYLRERKKQNG
ncbi:MAG: hypothetical protein KF726_10065 [Anaerolineae bacterium]|nr:hypothetical protein [Anaerolineae bacterium]